MAGAVQKNLPDLDRIYKNFDLLQSWEERYRYVIQLGRKLPVYPESEKNEEHLVRGCSSQVWMLREEAPGTDGSISFLADSESHLVKGLIAILMSLCGGKKAEEILTLDVKAVFGRLGLEKHLSVNRTNGFYAMVERVKSYAVEVVAAAI